MRLRNSAHRVLSLLPLAALLLSGAPLSSVTEAPLAPPQSTSSAPDAAQKPAAGQDVPRIRRQDGEFVFRKEVEEVILHATVVDDKKRLVTDLTRDAFTVFEDGKPQRITLFRREDIPVSLGIVIDNSGSMMRHRPAVNQAALNLVRASNREDEVFVVNFNDERWLDQDFTSDIAKLKDALERVVSRGGTALYDSVVASADHLKKHAKLNKRVLLVVTDGEDNASTYTLEQAIRKVQDNEGPTVYTIGILDSDTKKRAKRALRAFAQQTGGIAFFPGDIEEVDAISRTVARDIRNQYTIGYKPTNPERRAGFRSIRVDAKSRGYKRLDVRTRSGYYVSEEDTPTSSTPTTGGVPR